MDFTLRIENPKGRNMSVEIIDETGKTIHAWEGASDELLLPIEYETYLPAFLGSDALRERLATLETLCFALEKVEDSLRGETNKRLGQLFKTWREEKAEITRSVLAKTCGMNVTKFQSIEQGIIKNSLASCLAIIQRWEKSK